MKEFSKVFEMYEKDTFSKELGIQIATLTMGGCVLNLRITPSMLNGFAIVHGGVTYSLADTALAFAANTYSDNVALTIETSVSYFSPVKNGDMLKAVAELVNSMKKMEVYSITVTNQRDEKVLFMKGVVYKKAQ